MRVELGAPVVFVAAVDALWHVPESLGWDDPRTLCGLEGDVFAFSSVARRRRACGVCRARAPRDLVVPEHGPLPERRPASRYGKPKGKHARVTDAQLRALHHVYVNEPASVRELARRYWQQLGYANARSAAASLDGLFRDRGFALRTVSEALILRNTKHGRKPRTVDVGPENAAYRRWLKEQRSAYRPRCAGVRQQYPRKGEACTRPAMHGSEFCFSHDPGRAAQRNAIVSHMQSLRPGLVLELKAHSADDRQKLAA